MFETTNIQSDNSAEEWAIRSENWISELAELPKKRKRRERNSNPLILCGHGVSLRIENGTLVIRDGFTHYPQKRVQYRFFAGDLDLPSRILLLDGSGTLSFDVLSWLAEQDVALARVCWSGQVATVASGSGFAADRAKVDWQHQTRSDEALRRTFAADLISRKLRNSIATLESCFLPSPSVDRAIANAHEGIRALEDMRSGDLNTIRAIEGGRCAVSYFAAFKERPLKWTGLEKRPVPEDWMTYLSRSSLTSGKVAKNRMASHPLNAMLNYAYAVRHSQLKIQAIADGYDPTVGIMHNTHQGSDAFVLDIIEPERPNVDAVILQFVSSRTFAAADFVIRVDGVCRLSPQLARMVAALVI
jgi:CRISPR-associated protein Cas1